MQITRENLTFGPLSLSITGALIGTFYINTEGGNKYTYQVGITQETVSAWRCVIADGGVILVNNGGVNMTRTIESAIHAFVYHYNQEKG